MAMDVPIEEDCEEELTEAYGKEGACLRDGMVQEDGRVREKTHRGVLREDQ